MEACLSALRTAERSQCLAALKTYVVANKDTFRFEDGVAVLTDFVSEILKYVASDIACDEGQRLGLNALRILTRQKSGFANVLNREGAASVLRFTGVGNTAAISEATSVEALKCLCNLTYQHHEFSNMITACDGSSPFLLKCISDKDVAYDIRFYSARLVFLLSAVNPPLRLTIRQANGFRRLCDGVQSSLGITGNESNYATIDELSQADGDLAAESMKCIFNISMEVAKETTAEEIESGMMLVRIARILLSSRKLMDREDLSPLCNQVTYMLINLPASCSDLFAPRTYAQFSADAGTVVLDGRNVTAAAQLRRQLDSATTSLATAAITTSAGDGVVPLVTAMANCGRACPPARRYWRKHILPMLRTVVNRPDEGDSLKARLIRLMTSPHTNLASTVADFLFVLCKENAGRLVKHTGYGNAAGLLLQRGLLSGSSGVQSADYSSDSDSDNQEYRDSNVNVMTGGPTPDDQDDPLAGMTEEEKEAEAEKLGELMHKLENTGVLKVMRLGDKPGLNGGACGTAAATAVAPRNGAAATARASDDTASASGSGGSADAGAVSSADTNAVGSADAGAVSSTNTNAVGSADTGAACGGASQDTNGDDEK